MDVVKGVGVVVVEDDMGDGMQCSDHPYRNNPGGICASCLQEKLGKLVSSSFPLPIRVSSSSSSSPSFRSDAIGSINSVSSNVAGVGSGSSSLSLAVTRHGNNNGGTSGLSSHYQEYYSSRRAKIPFLLAKKKKIMAASSASSTSVSVADHRDIVFKRSKSTAATRTRNHFLDNDQDFSPRKRNGFWSFLYHSSKPNKNLTINPTAATTTDGSRCVGSDIHIVMEEEEDESPSSHATASAASSFERKVSRSRSVGCGSRSFSGDFFERISTGFGDCTLRRVESQREGKQKVTTTTTAAAHHHHHHMKEKVKCGGLFGGFVITSSSSSSSSSSYWVSSSSADDINGKPPTGSLAHGRNKSWGWAFASPMRAFGPKPSSKDGKRDLNKKTTPDLAAIPSLLVGA